MTGLLENSKPTACYFQWNSWKLRLEGHPSNLDRLVEQTPVEWKNVSPEPYPWKKSYFWKNKTFFGPTFPFPWSPGLSSLTLLGRQLSCQSRKVKSSPATSFALPQIHFFSCKDRGIYIQLIFSYLITAFPVFFLFQNKSSSGERIQTWNRSNQISNTNHEPYTFFLTYFK